MPSLHKSPMIRSQVYVVGNLPQDGNRTVQEHAQANQSTQGERWLSNDAFMVLHGNYNTANNLLEAETMWNLRQAPQELANAVPVALAKSTMSTGKDVLADLINGKQTFSQASGKLVSEVSSAVITSSATTFANKAIVAGLTRLEASSPVTLIAGMCVGFIVNRATTFGLEDSGFKQYLFDQTAGLLHPTYTLPE
jgi:hypothetical protein